jgi:membrane peptidoglycan carboxypeptidase
VEEPRRRRASPRVLLLAVALPLVLLTGLAAAVWLSTDVPLPGEVRNPQATVVQYADGSELGRVGAQRVSVPLDQVSLEAQRAVLAAEERDFYSSPGVSVRGIARALWVNVRGGEVSQGGSTITQQYVRNAYLSRERTLSRKLREVAVSLKLSRTYSKDEVLGFYLDTVYFGRGAYGIEAAARTWFGRPAADLTASEGAVLAALLRSPQAYDPERSPEQARKRWRYVLDGMAEQGWLDGPARAQGYPAVLPRTATPDRLGGPEGYLVAQALEEVARRDVPELRRDQGGLVVRTTLDPQAQAAAVAAARTLGGDVPAGVYQALVSVQPGTGRIVAEYAGPDYVSRPFNSVTQGSAQAGSSFKPYVLAAALERGVSLRSRWDGSSPQQFGDYRVRNSAGASYGQVDLVEATARSINTVFVPLGKRAGLRAVADTAAAMGITADMRRDDGTPAISLGITSVRPLDQAAAFATLAAGGVHAEPYLVEQVTDRGGRVLYTARPVTRRALSADVAADVTHALTQVVSRGTGEAARVAGRPAAGKTGTTSENTAAWFVGYTPQLATAVAVYSERRDVPLRGFAGVREVTGGTLPARAFSDFTLAALQGQPVERFGEPAFVGAVPSETPPPGPTPSPLPPRDDTPGPPPPVQPLAEAPQPTGTPLPPG